MRTAWKNITKNILLLVLTFIVLKANSQGFSSDSNIANQAKDSFQVEYKSTIKENLRLYNGNEYSRQRNGIKGTPFLCSDSLMEADINYENHFYKRISANYDLVDDELVIQDYLHKNLIILDSKRIQNFIVNKRIFINMNQDSLRNYSFKNGFYEKIYDGKLSVFVKREKIAGIPLGIDQNDLQFLSYNYYYVKFGHEWYPFKNLRSFLSLVEDKKAILKQLIKINKLSFKKNIESSLIRLSKYYSEL